MLSNNPNEYLEEVLQKYQTNASDLHQIVDHFKPIINNWGKPYCNDLIVMGSIAQGVFVKKEMGLDLDLLVSMKSDTPFTVKELYESLHKYLKSKNYKVELRNISMRIKYNGISVDFVPSIKTPGNTDFHTVYSRKEDKEMPSNVEMHKKIVKVSGRKREIQLMKIWSSIHNIPFDGFTLALTTIEALKGKPKNELASNFITVLNYIVYKFENVKFADPSRPEDIISDNMEPEEKKKAIKVAKKCLKESYINNIIW